MTVNPERKRDEDEVSDILWESLRTLRSDFQTLNKAIDFNETNSRKLAILVNARARIQQQIFYCIALMRDPKLELMTTDGRQKDFARMMQKILIEENPVVAKLVEKAR